MFVFQTINAGPINPAEQAQESQRKRTFKSNPVVETENKIQGKLDDALAISAYNKATNESITGKSPKEIMSTLLTTQAVLKQTLVTSRDVVVVEDAQERLKAIDQFFQICKITDEELASYRAYLEFQKSNLSIDNLANQTKAGQRMANKAQGDIQKGAEFSQALTANLVAEEKRVEFDLKQKIGKGPRVA